MFLANKLNKGGSSGGYQISRSLRFNSADSAYLNRTPASAGNRRTWTFSAWVKRGSVDANYRSFFSNGNAVDTILFWNDNSLAFRNFNGSSYDLITTQVFRDPSAWYHLVIAMDTTQATSSNRIKIYVNGVQVTAFATATYPSQNYDTGFNTTTVQYLGYNEYNYFNGYLTEINFVDGTQLTPSSFGETNAQTGVWQPKAYSGSYGTNGFKLNFSDNSNTTAATLGADSSGNGNNFTPNNFSVTAGSGNDSLVDSPTSYGTDTGAGGSVRGNYCTWNPLSNSINTVSNGNLNIASASGNASTRCNSTISVSSDKWYFEATLAQVGTNSACGIGQNQITNQYVGQDALSYGFELDNARKANNSTLTSYGSALTAGDVFMCAFDLDNNKIFFGKNGTWFDSSNPATGTNPAFSLTTGTYNPIARPYNGNTAGASFDANFGQRPFAYTAPSGFKALCTQNLPTPTVGATTATLATKYFNPITYSGSGSQSVTGVGFQPDWVWVKSRSSGVYNHQLHDAVRGATAGALFSNLTSAQDNLYQFDSFDSDGFTTDSSNITGINNTGQTFVAWNWKANGAGSTNTAGSITSTVSANTTSGFSVVTYTGTGANATVGHGLGAALGMIIIKDRTASNFWVVGSTSISFTSDQYLRLNANSAVEVGGGVAWNSTAPTSTVFSIGTSSVLNASSNNYVAYCFAPIAGYSAFDQYIGNGSADGPFIYTGFRPAFVMIKSKSGGESWLMFDSVRNTYNVTNNKLAANSTVAENDASIGDSTQNNFDFLSNGFKAVTTNSGTNGSGSVIIYMAFAQNPFKYSLAR